MRYTVPMLGRMQNNPYIRSVVRTYSNLSWTGKAGLFIVVFYILLAVFSPYIAPYDPFTSQRFENGELALLSPPSGQFILGTNNRGYDLFSQLILGSRTSVFVGFVAAIIMVMVGANLGLIAGYYGGRVDNLIMRFTDLVFGLPFLPFVIVYISIMGQNTLNVVIGISAILWRATARVTRSKVLQIREEQFIDELKSMGVSNLRIIYRHIMPNVLPIIILYGAIGLGSAVIIEANLSFLGLGPTQTASWGRTLFKAFQTGVIADAWWWSFPPGIAISSFVLGVFMFGRSLEQTIDPELGDEQ